MPDIESKEKKEKIKISKLHLLIHPGYNTDPDQPDYGDNAPQYSYLMNRYLERAKEIKTKPDELMAAFLHTKENALEADLKKEKIYARIIRELKKILGRQLIVISDEHKIDLDPLAFEAAKKIINARGYEFDENVFTEAFGECYGVCVNNARRKLQETGDFKKEIPINRQLTDGALDNKSLRTTIE